MVSKRRRKVSSGGNGNARHGKGGSNSSASKKVVLVSARSEDKGAKEAAVKPVSGWKLWLFRGIAVLVVPVFVLVLIEVGLRVAGYGYPANSILRTKVDGEARWCDNVEFCRRFFPRHLAREMTPFSIAVDKPKDTCRIFVLGASAAQGVPEKPFCFGRILESMLRQRYPGVNFEVVTAAMVAVNSHVILEAAKDCARCDPDLFVVYLGNNEVTGPYGAGTIFSPLSGNLSLIRAGVAAKGTRLGQLLSGLLTPKTRAQDMWRGMEMFIDKQVRADDASLGIVYGHFEKNVEDIVWLGRKAGAEVVVCTVGSNLKDNPPFGSLHRSDLSGAEKGKWDEIYEQGTASEAAEEYAEAVELYLSALEIDGDYANLHFRLGRCYWAMGEYDKAHVSYIKARELDTLRFRADDRINAAIRAVASRGEDRGVHLVDSVKVFAQNSPEGVAGEELFYEHVHLNFRGNYLLAGAVFEKVEQLLPERIRRLRSEDAGVPSQADCAARLAYTDWDRYKIAEDVLDGFIRKPPFTNQLYHTERVERMVRDLAALKANLTDEVIERSARQYRDAISGSKDDWYLHKKYGVLLAEFFEDYPGAIEEYRIVQRLIRHSWIGYNSLGIVLHIQGDVAGAIPQFEKAIQAKPSCGHAHYYLGCCRSKMGEADKALKHYRLAVRWEPNCMPAYNNWAEILVRRGDLEEAVKVFRRGLVFCPDSAILHCNMGGLLNQMGQRDEAVKELRRALELEPNSAPIRGVLDRMLGNGG
ncbi:MAG: tetratricopeptide repeat protein [Sedimentisphaerales bacterium]|nr:tetratricopeptide repeat protein [Sedimentisphaerales bacterium]